MNRNISLYSDDAKDIVAKLTFRNLCSTGSFGLLLCEGFGGVRPRVWSTHP